MTAWVIPALCCGGAGLVAWGSARLSLRWPLAALAVMLAAIAGQLYLAARGQGGYHDLAAATAQTHTVVPALAGVAAGLSLAAAMRHRVRLRGLAGLATLACLLAAAAFAGATAVL